ncbi:MAG TPA: Holliday junction resolvase RuvX [Candidatus Paceibacterota bacterium]
MRYLGIDYGLKRVGVAFSDETGEFALPHSVLPNDKKLLVAVTEICRNKDAKMIVLGESKNFAGEDNLLQEQINQFKKALEKRTGLPIILEPEFFTSAEAARLQEKTVKLDASAAALILKSFLDKKKNNEHI